MAVTFPYVRAATWVDGSTTDTAAKRNTIEDGIFNAHQQPAVRVTHNVAQAIVTATNTVLAFNTERFDQAGGASAAHHDTVTNNSRLTCLYAGVYQITGIVEFAANATGGRTAFIRLNGATIISNLTVPISSGTVGTNLVVTCLYSLAVNDYVELLVSQNSGGNLNVNVTAQYSPEFMMVRVA